MADGANFSDTLLDGADLTEASVREAEFSWASLMGVVAHSLDAEGAEFKDAWLCGAVLLESNLEDAEFSGASLVGADLSTAVNASSAEFTGAYYDADTSMPADADTSEMIEVLGPCPGDPELALVDTDGDGQGDECHDTPLPGCPAMPLPEPHASAGLLAGAALLAAAARARRRARMLPHRS